MAESSSKHVEQDHAQHNRLVIYIIVAMVLAFVLALVAPKFAMYFDIGGQIFLKMLQMIIVPLVMASVMSGILGLGDVRKLGKPGLAAVVYYMTTTLMAVVTGLIIVNLIQPGTNISPEFVEQAAERGDEVVEHVSSKQAEDTDMTVSAVFKGLILKLFTNNLLKSMTEMDLLPLIVFSLIFAGMLTTMGKRSEVVANLIMSINDALMNFVMLLMRLSPLGIFCLVTAKFGTAVDEGTLFLQLQAQAGYIASVLIGLGIHAIITLPLLLWMFTRRNPYIFILHMGQSILTAFSTASSTATLPITMECAERNAGVSEESTNFVLPLGATINMDGTALYEAVAAIFLANIYAATHDDFTLGFSQQVTIAVTATLAAIGAAGIPEAGLFTMMIVLKAIGLPPTMIALILPLDWLLDRFRTAVNAFGDAVGAAIVDQTFDLAEESDAGSVSDADDPAPKVGGGEDTAAES